MELIKSDRETGLQLYREMRTEPGGGLAVLYKFNASYGLPSHLAPGDPADGRAAYKAFDAIVAWRKANPHS